MFLKDFFRNKAEPSSKMTQRAEATFEKTAKRLEKEIARLQQRGGDYPLFINMGGKMRNLNEDEIAAIKKLGGYKNMQAICARGDAKIDIIQEEHETFNDWPLVTKIMVTLNHPSPGRLTRRRGSAFSNT